MPSKFTTDLQQTKASVYLHFSSKQGVVGLFKVLTLFEIFIPCVLISIVVTICLKFNRWCNLSIPKKINPIVNRNCRSKSIPIWVTLIIQIDEMVFIRNCLLSLTNMTFVRRHQLESCSSIHVFEFMAIVPRSLIWIRMLLLPFCTSSLINFRLIPLLQFTQMIECTKHIQQRFLFRYLQWWRSGL